MPRRGRRKCGRRIWTCVHCMTCKTLIILLGTIHLAASAARGVGVSGVTTTAVAPGSITWREHPEPAAIVSIIMVPPVAVAAVAVVAVVALIPHSGAGATAATLETSTVYSTATSAACSTAPLHGVGLPQPQPPPQPQPSRNKRHGPPAPAQVPTAWSSAPLRRSAERVNPFQTRRASQIITPGLKSEIGKESTACIAVLCWKRVFPHSIFWQRRC
mmetsp:Transcript_18236/g.45340  ORF Transcript_18236/g.45340 Transcript_18236/m.45340 type:complete len:216 (-) Transcript_18236:282-929(-)